MIEGNKGSFLCLVYLSSNKRSYSHCDLCLIRICGCVRDDITGMQSINFFDFEWTFYAHSTKWHWIVQVTSTSIFIPQFFFHNWYYNYFNTCETTTVKYIHKMFIRFAMNLNDIVNFFFVKKRKKIMVKTKMVTR